MSTRTRMRDVAQFVLCIAVLTAARSRNASAQKKPAPEFTRQSLLISNFRHDTVGDKRIGRKAASAVRSRMLKLVNRKEVDVVDNEDVALELEKAGYDINFSPTLGELRLLGRVMRADEYLMGSIDRVGNAYRLSGELVLVRDERLRQPLPSYTAPSLDAAADQFARSAAAARAQLIPERRCENALRDGKGAEALAHARAGVAAYASSTLARTCLVWSLRATHAPATEVLTVAQEVLAIDSINPHVLEAAAISLDSLRRRDEAARMWLRLARTDTTNLELQERVANALVDGGNKRPAEDFLVPLVKKHPDYVPLVRQKWRVAFDNRDWPVAIEAAESLMQLDELARDDSTFHLRLATAYRADGKPFKSIETLSHAVPRFPGDARLYTLYTQYIRAEADTVIPRGLALFPKSGDLLAMQARELRSRGKLQESLDAARQAVTADSTLSQGQLMVAQVEMELGRPDSALASLRRALSGGEDTALVAQFALAKGNSLYRAAGGTKTSSDFSLALRFLALSDSLRASPQSQLLVGAAALGVAQAALTEAPKLSDKTESCRLARLGAEMLPMAKSALTAGQDAFPEAAKQSLENAGVLDPYAAQQVQAFCQVSAAPTPPT